MRIIVLILFLIFFVYSIFDLFTDVKSDFEKDSDKFNGFYRLEDVIDFPVGEKSLYIKIMKDKQVYNLSFDSNDNNYLKKNNIRSNNVSSFIKKNLKLKLKEYKINNDNILLSIYFYNSSSSHPIKSKKVPIECSFMNSEGIVLDILHFNIPLVLNPKEVILLKGIKVPVSKKISNYLISNKKLNIECDIEQ